MEDIIKIVKSFEDSGLLLKGVIEKFQNEFNSFPSNVPLIYPPENIRKSEDFWCFQGVYKWNIGWKWVKEQKGGFLTTLFSTLGVSLLRNILKLKRINRERVGFIRAGYGSKWSLIKDF